MRVRVSHGTPIGRLRPVTARGGRAGATAPERPTPPPPLHRGTAGFPAMQADRPTASDGSDRRHNPATATQGTMHCRHPQHRISGKLSRWGAAHHVEGVGQAERVEAVLLSNVALEPLRRIEHRRDLWTRAALCEQLRRRPGKRGAAAGWVRLRGRAFDLAIMVTWFARAPGRAVVAWYALDTPQRARDEATSRIEGAGYIYIAGISIIFRLNMQARGAPGAPRAPLGRRRHGRALGRRVDALRSRTKRCRAV